MVTKAHANNWPQTGNAGKILITDDNPEILSLVSEILTLHGFDAIKAPGGSEALEIMGYVKPDVIICDIMMPEVSGLDLFAKVRQLRELSDIPFLFLTALSDTPNLINAKIMGCDDYITKPFDPEELLASIRGKLSRIEQQRASQNYEYSQYRRKVIQTLSHEMRTPLVSILTGSELLLEQPAGLDPATAKRLLSAIYKGGLRLHRLVEDFITIQQINSGIENKKADAERQRCDLIDIVDTAIDEVKKEHSKCRVSFQRPEKEHILALSNYGHIKTALCRIIDNAIKFGGLDKNIDIWIEEHPNHVSIHVRDCGPGIEECHTSSAFETFYQINRESKEQQGCGLGLSIANALVKSNGGTIVLKSPLGQKGLQVEINLPTSSPGQMQES